MQTRNSGLPPTAQPNAAPPAPSPAFHWTTETWGHALRAHLLQPHAQHLFTSSQLRLPAPPAQEIDGDEVRARLDDEARERAWTAVAASLGVERGRLFRVRQVHGRVIRVVRADDPASMDATALPDGDALVSNVAGVALAVVVADCVPVLIVDPRAGTAAAVHAGWRGTAAGIVTAAIGALAEHWGSRPPDMLAAIGPSIGPDDYQVGNSLVDAFRDAGHGESVDRWFRRVNGCLHLDLWRANRDQLEAVGVPAGNIVSANLSTAVHPGWLESYRRDGARAGRLVAAIVVPPAAGT